MAANDGSILMERTARESVFATVDVLLVPAVFEYLMVQQELGGAVRLCSILANVLAAKVSQV